MGCGASSTYGPTEDAFVPMQRLPQRESSSSSDDGSVAVRAADEGQMSIPRNVETPQRRTFGLKSKKWHSRSKAWRFNASISQKDGPRTATPTAANRSLGSRSVSLQDDDGGNERHISTTLAESQNLVSVNTFQSEVNHDESSPHSFSARHGGKLRVAQETWDEGSEPTESTHKMDGWKEWWVHGRPPIDCDEVMPCFPQRNGLLFRLTNNGGQQWNYYNDTIEYAMRVTAWFSHGSSIVPLGKTAFGEVSYVTGKLDEESEKMTSESNQDAPGKDDVGQRVWVAQLIVEPLATEPFLRGSWIGGYRVKYDVIDLRGKDSVELQPQQKLPDLKAFAVQYPADVGVVGYTSAAQSDVPGAPFTAMNVFRKRTLHGVSGDTQQTGTSVGGISGFQPDIEDDTSSTSIRTNDEYDTHIPVLVPNSGDLGQAFVDMIREEREKRAGEDDVKSLSLKLE